MKLRTPLLIASTAQVMAFAPSPAFPSTRSGGATGATVPRPAATTALHMSFVDRFFRVAKANVNLVVSSLEDPEKIMDQAVTDMQKDLVKVRQAYAQVTAAQRRLEQQKAGHESVAEDWYQRAQLALQRGQEDLARHALARRQVALDEANSVQQELNVNGAAVEKLYDSMQLLNQKIVEAQSKKEQMAARARTAKMTVKVNDMLSGVTGKTSLDAFKRMEQKVEALEAAAEASAEMGSLSSANALPGSDDLEKEFLYLEASAAVEDELQQLKGALSQGSKLKALKEAGSRPTIERDFRVEQEFRDLKKSNIKIPLQMDRSSSSDDLQ